MVGKIQTYDELRGYGFILQNFRDRIFFHVNQWQSNTPPVAGMVVLYDLIPSRKSGFQHQAGNVRPVETGLSAEENEKFVLALNDGGAQ
jgi:cold shock CspA family protein